MRGGRHPWAYFLGHVVELVWGSSQNFEIFPYVKMVATHCDCPRVFLSGFAGDNWRETEYVDGPWKWQTTAFSVSKIEKLSEFLVKCFNIPKSYLIYILYLIYIHVD